MKYYNADELANMFNVHKETIKREVARNKLRCFKVGTELRFTQEHVDEYTNVVNLGRTTRELELEEELEKLKIVMSRKNSFIEIIKDEIIKLN